MQFHFRLTPIEEVTLWSDSEGRHSLSWFGLTDGWFWIEAGSQELFRYSHKAREHWARRYPAARPALLPYENYQVARYWEDLLEMSPAILDPVPADLAARIADAAGWRRFQDNARRWYEESGGDDEAVWDVHYTAVGWWQERTWDAGHLTHPPHLWLWRVEDTIYIRWNNREVVIEEDIPVWEAQACELTLPVSEFLRAVQSFNDRFLAEMAIRTNEARAAWPRPDVEIDLDALAYDQADRLTWLARAIRPWTAQAQRSFSWEEVRKAIQLIEEAQA